MNSNLPTVVRLVRFPQSYRLTRKGRQYVGPLRRSGPIVQSDRHGAIDCTFRVTAPGVTFSTGGTSITVTEAFDEGEQRDLHVPWGLIVDAGARPAIIAIEIDIKYSDTPELHTATAPLKLTYGASTGRAIGVAAAAVAVAAAGAAVAAKRKKKTIVVDDDEDVELALFNVASTKRAPAKAGTRPPKGSKVTVLDEEDADVAVLNTGRRATSKKTAKKSSSKKTASKKAASKKAPAKKAASTKKSASKKQAGGTRRGSGASRSAPRKGARGSSSARKSPSRRTTRKSR